MGNMEVISVLLHSPLQLSLMFFIAACSSRSSEAAVLLTVTFFIHISQRDPHHIMVTVDYNIRSLELMDCEQHGYYSIMASYDEFEVLIDIMLSIIHPLIIDIRLSIIHPLIIIMHALGIGFVAIIYQHMEADVCLLITIIMGHVSYSSMPDLVENTMIERHE